jgi:hypothetical protein
MEGRTERRRRNTIYFLLLTPFMIPRHLSMRPYAVCGYIRLHSSVSPSRSLSLSLSHVFIELLPAAPLPHYYLCASAPPHTRSSRHRSIHPASPPSPPQKKKSIKQQSHKLYPQKRQQYMKLISIIHHSTKPQAPSSQLPHGSVDKQPSNQSKPGHTRVFLSPFVFCFARKKYHINAPSSLKTNT